MEIFERCKRTQSVRKSIISCISLWNCSATLIIQSHRNIINIWMQSAFAFMYIDGKMSFFFFFFCQVNLHFCDMSLLDIYFMSFVMRLCAYGFQYSCSTVCISLFKSQMADEMTFNGKYFASIALESSYFERKCFFFHSKVRYLNRIFVQNSNVLEAWNLPTLEIVYKQIRSLTI